MSPGLLRGSYPVDENGEVPEIPRYKMPSGRLYLIETHGEDRKTRAFRAISWFGETGVEWLDDPTDLAEETLARFPTGK